ncbi:hypothetical protein BJX70DRAFT_394292 [Aspergillus crustosus]
MTLPTRAELASAPTITTHTPLSKASLKVSGSDWGKGHTDALHVYLIDKAPPQRGFPDPLPTLDDEGELHQQDPTLAFVGAVAAGFTFEVFEWQTVLAARVFTGKATLPPIEEQKEWEAKRIEQRRDSTKLTLISPDFEQYFETIRNLATTPRDGEPGRRLPKFNPSWVGTFAASQQRRIKMWKRANEAARASRSQAKGDRVSKLGIDLSVLPLLCFGMILFQLDRMNVASALTGGFAADVGVTQDTINLGKPTHVPRDHRSRDPFKHALAKVQIGPSKWIPAQVFVFGLIATMQVLHNVWVQVNCASQAERSIGIS